jgi:hypothetical protein
MGEVTMGGAAATTTANPSPSQPPAPPHADSFGACCGGGDGDGHREHQQQQQQQQQHQQHQGHQRNSTAAMMEIVNTILGKSRFTHSDLDDIVVACELTHLRLGKEAGTKDARRLTIKREVEKLSGMFV